MILHPPVTASLLRCSSQPPCIIVPLQPFVRLLFFSRNPFVMTPCLRGKFKPEESPENQEPRHNPGLVATVSGS